MVFEVGDLLEHRVNPDLGPGRVEAREGRRITLFFPRSGSRLTFNASDEALVKVTLAPGAPATLDPDGEPVVVARRSARPAIGCPTAGRWMRMALAPGAPARPSAAAGSARRRRRGTLRQPARRALVLDHEREAGGLGSFLGGRIQLFPHQLQVAERAVASEPVRWLLADEVGLGKTVEACLILTRLLRTRRAERARVVAPGILTVQWLSELWRKFHQVFVLLDAARRVDVARELGRGMNPFEAHARMKLSGPYAPRKQKAPTSRLRLREQTADGKAAQRCEAPRKGLQGRSGGRFGGADLGFGLRREVGQVFTSWGTWPSRYGGSSLAENCRPV